ncbi:pyrroloquinoline quinone biosynthesis peptide chaperone PqqD [Kitasatospora sp. NPDC057692]|uniref:pyrroloquinoline quinone biosynthesis peptide chaperone PqqD n=1 Tax=Kitasatospora sp. NPDC057692 TaxID=3346215 RepID=UPI0036D0D494
MSTRPRTNTAPAAPWHPALSPAAVLRHDPRRGAHLLILPERVIVLHGHATAVVALCDGTRTVETIVEELTDRFPRAPIAHDVPAFLDGLRREGCLR